MVTVQAKEAFGTPPLTHEVKTILVPSGDQSGEPASQPKSVSRRSVLSIAGAPAWRSQMSSLASARYEATGVRVRCEWKATHRPSGDQTGEKSS